MAIPKTRSVQKAFAMLRAFRAPDELLTCAELSRRAGLPGPSGYRLIQTLEDLGAVIRDGRGRYSPGMLLLSLSRNVPHDRLLREASHLVLEDLARDLGLVANMGVFHDSMVTYVAKIGGYSDFHVHTEVGMQSEAYCSALGKVLLAALRDYELQTFLADGELIGLTANTITEPRAFRREIEKIRAQGWAFDDGEFAEHMRCLAAPVRDAAGQVLAAISLSGEVSAFTPDRQPRILGGLSDAAAAISANIGRFGGASTFRLPPAERKKPYVGKPARAAMSA